MLDTWVQSLSTKTIKLIERGGCCDYFGWKRWFTVFCAKLESEIYLFIYLFVLNEFYFIPFIAENNFIYQNSSHFKKKIFFFYFLHERKLWLHATGNWNLWQCLKMSRNVGKLMLGQYGLFVHADLKRKLVFFCGIKWLKWSTCGPMLQLWSYVNVMYHVFDCKLAQYDWNM